MLVLTRRVGEQIVIAGNIRVNVVAVQGERVRLGIEAPMSVAVDRQEVHERRNTEQLTLSLPAVGSPGDPARHS